MRPVILPIEPFIGAMNCLLILLGMFALAIGIVLAMEHGRRP